MQISWPEYCDSTVRLDGERRRAPRSCIMLARGTGSTLAHCVRMSKTSLERQADRAERLADNTVDERMKQILLDAARDYREQAQQRDTQDDRGRVGDRPHLAWSWSGASEQPRSMTGF